MILLTWETPWSMQPTHDKRCRTGSILRASVDFLSKSSLEASTHPFLFLFIFIFNQLTIVITSDTALFLN